MYMIQYFIELDYQQICQLTFVPESRAYNALEVVDPEMFARRLVTMSL